MPSALRFLVVDEHSPMRRIVVNLLKDNNYTEVEEAEDGSSALHKLRAARFDFVITATQMPVMGGLQLLGEMKKDTTLRHIPVLLVSAEARREEIVLAGQLGASGYVVKPFTKAILEDKVVHILRRLKLQ